MSELSRSAVLRAYISRSALALGAERAVGDGGAGIADLRRDAWGHGLLGVAQATIAAGAGAVLVDGAPEAEALRMEGIPAVYGEEPNLDSSLLYGLPDPTGELPGKPVMRAAGRVLSVKDIAEGGGVSYGYVYRAEKDSRLALVSGGYAQGIVRSLGNHAKVEINGIRHPIVGRIAMDVCVVDIGEAQIALEDEVVYFGGNGVAAAALSEWTQPTGMSVPELVAVIGQKAERSWES